MDDSAVIAQERYRGLWEDAYRDLVDDDPGRDGRYEAVQTASGVSWRSGERLTPREIVGRVELVTRCRFTWWCYAKFEHDCSCRAAGSRLHPWAYQP